MEIGDLSNEAIEQDLYYLARLKKEILTLDNLSSPTTGRLTGAITNISMELRKIKNAGKEQI